MKKSIFPKRSIKTTLYIMVFVSITFNKSYSQDNNLKELEYTVIAEGIDSPIPNLQILCFNKYFNKDYLPAKFLEKYNLNKKELYKKKMLIELFHSDDEKKGLDKIKIMNISENDKTLIISYNLINSDKSNDNKVFAPFLIIQVPKSKKAIKFMLNGIEKGKTTKVYVD